MSLLKQLALGTFKRLPGPNLFYYLQGEFHDNPRDLAPALAHTIYAATFVVGLTIFAMNKLDPSSQNTAYQSEQTKGERK